MRYIKYSYEIVALLGKSEFHPQPFNELKFKEKCLYKKHLDIGHLTCLCRCEFNLNSYNEKVIDEKGYGQILCEGDEHFEPEKKYKFLMTEKTIINVR